MILNGHKGSLWKDYLENVTGKNEINDQVKKTLIIGWDLMGSKIIPMNPYDHLES